VVRNIKGTLISVIKLQIRKINILVMHIYQ